ncbi:hypothetical protein [Alkalicoccus halolimnae]|uniref:PD-(D/E)XK nuclease superfamily protein n=1 Tax=Alkalicoccus halolimnae TaxID=1667239 RepID=A0A5C7FGA8_9BACI|nr:hypothetical protein [Alkalicoccus halolimnae]TXF85304.1 hypothetical protein FTX54_08940 [Alkalicoccus halolimnae]
MTDVHYFPRYSQKENMVTNNTLLLFSRLYQNSPAKFSLFINSILEDNEKELNTSVQFKQQERSSSGRVPDGIISQESFKVVIETKLYSQQNIPQIKGHLDAFEKEDNQIFLWIDKEPITATYKKLINDELLDYNKNNGTDIKFASTTFKEIAHSFKDILQEFDLEMIALIDDYEKFCHESGLVDNLNNTVRVVLTGNTFDENIKHKIYFHPQDRGYQNTKYIGLYKDKAIRAIGKITGIVDAQYDENSQDFASYEDILGSSTKTRKDQIKQIILESKAKHSYPAEEARRFFFVDEYHETEYIKTSKGGIAGVRYLDLSEVKGYKEKMNAEEIAELLKGEHWGIL